MRRTIVWLEDEPSTIQDILYIVSQKLNVNILLFTTISQLSEYLISLKENNSEQLQNLVMILDLMIAGSPIIFCPKTWGQKDKVFNTNNGYDAGLVFYEQFILGIDSEQRPLICPPAIFLSVMYENAEIKERLNVIRNAYSKFHNVSVDRSKIKWLRKWDLRGYEWIEEYLEY